MQSLFSDGDREQLLALLREAERLSATLALQRDTTPNTNFALTAYRISRLMIQAEEGLGEELARLQAEIDPDLEGLWHTYRKRRWRLSLVQNQVVLHLGPSISESVAVTLSSTGEVSGIPTTYTCSQLWELDLLTKNAASACCPICHGGGHPGEEDSSLELLFTPGGRLLVLCCQALETIDPEGLDELLAAVERKPEMARSYRFETRRRNGESEKFGPLTLGVGDAYRHFFLLSHTIKSRPVQEEDDNPKTEAVLYEDGMEVKRVVAAQEYI
jgi:hypothetical protein